MPQLRRTKQEEKDQQLIQELLKQPENKKCFDCPNKIPSYVNLSIQTFICSRCSGLIREVGHRVKSLTASNFSGPEAVALQLGGNAVARSIWLGSYKGTAPEPETDNEVRWFMRQKYYESKWLNNELLKEHMEKVKTTIKELFTADGERRTQIKTSTQRHSGVISPPPSSSSPQPPKLSGPEPLEKRQSWLDDNTPLGLSQSTSLRDTSERKKMDLFDIEESSPQNTRPTSSPHELLGAFTGPTTNSTTIPQASSPPIAKTESNLFDDLASLQINTAPKIPLYGGGMLSPSQSGQAPSSSQLRPASSPTSKTRINSSPFGSPNTSWSQGDPYSAFRSLQEQKPLGSPNVVGQQRRTSTHTSYFGQPAGPSIHPIGQPRDSRQGSTVSPKSPKSNDDFFKSLDPFSS
ncbi:hypothetical protein INT43_004118 [Umbelopsis isabellina]|uniref:Arf-GAP domain-containing protein n=1 Tax=Mortierella isabellina TaxID=91625 RepID=A0A8H7UBR8_MORIS|nr:hypothetical protein INT43_004118 [Umbelopsis isabellina]